MSLLRRFFHTGLRASLALTCGMTLTWSAVVVSSPPPPAAQQQQQQQQEEEGQCEEQQKAQGEKPVVQEPWWRSSVLHAQEEKAGVPPPQTVKDIPFSPFFLADVAEAASPAVVEISTYERTYRGDMMKTGSGSGFIIDPRGTILTNCHVVASPYTNARGFLEVTLADGRQYTADVEAYDETIDIAVLKISNPPKNGEPFKYLALGKSSEVRVGEFAMALGCPQGLQNTATLGIVSNRSRHASELGMPDRRLSYIQTDAPISFGNSGGPLINVRGEVIGINTVVVKSLGQIGFAIPADVAMEAIEQLRVHGKVRTPWVGVVLMGLTTERALFDAKKSFPQKITEDVREGVLVIDVITGGPAQKAGLEPGDVIVKIDGHPTFTARDVLEHVRSVGQEMNCSIRRADKSFDAKITVNEEPQFTPPRHSNRRRR